MMVASLQFHQVAISQGTSLPEAAHFVYSNGPAIWHGLPDIMHMKVQSVQP